MRPASTVLGAGLPHRFASGQNVQISSVLLKNGVRELVGAAGVQTRIDAAAAWSL